MRPDQIARFTDTVRLDAATRFGLTLNPEQTLDGFENVVLEAEREGRPYVIRLTHHTHRTVDMVHAELHWIDYLSSHGVSVCRPVRSRSDSLVESIRTDSDQFLAVAFERAPGGPVKREHWTDAMTRNRGSLLGRIHHLTKRYEPLPAPARRLHWYDDDDFMMYRQYLPAEDRVVGDRFEQLQAYLRKLATDPDSYGLIHMDAHTGNIFFDGDRPTLFDFDDCCYDFLVSDIAISLFYAVVMYPDEKHRSEFARHFLTTFLEGYREQNRLDNRWRELIPWILKRREMVLYVAIHNGFDPENFDEWCRAYRDRHRERIINRTPYLDLDWSQFDLGR